MNTPVSSGSILTNARLVLADEVLERGAVLIEQGRISRVFRGEPAIVPHGLPEHDLTGLTLFPGFIDLHIHGAVGIDTLDASPESLSRVSQFLAAQGVTGWLPTLVPGPAEQYQHAMASIDALMRQQHGRETAFPFGDSPSESRALGVHYEGPFVSSQQCGALHLDHFRTFSSGADLDALPTLSAAGAVQMMTMAPEIEGGIELVRELQQRGWIVSIGHTRAGVDLLDRAFEAGARHMTHFMNAMAPLHHRAPGPIGWGLLRDDVTCDVIADGVHLDRMTLRLLEKLKTPGRLMLISDSISAAGLGDGDYQIWGETISVARGRTQNSSGTIAGSVITMLDAVRMMLSLGASAVDVAQMASTNPARLLRLEKECGSIEEGKRADLAAIDQKGQVRLTIVGGQVVVFAQA